MCVCNWIPLREVCPDYKVVMFQPQTVATTDLGSVAILPTLNLSLPPHLFIPFFWIVLFSIPLYNPAIGSRSSSYTSICLRLPSTSYPGVKPCPPGSCLHLPPATCHLPPSTCQPPPLVFASRTAYLRLLLFPLTVRPPPFPPLFCAQVPVRPWGVRLSRVPLSPLCSSLSLPDFSSKS